MSPKELYEKVNAEAKRTKKPVAFVCKKLKVPLWKYYRGRQLALGITHGKKTKKVSSSIPLPETGGKVVLVMGTPDQIRSMLS